MMTYKELQTALKSFKADGRTSIKLNATKDVLQAEYDRLTVTTETATETTVIEVTATERREMVNQYYDLVKLANQYENSSKWEEIWDDVQALKAQIDNTVITEMTIIAPEVNPTTDNEIETDTSEIVIEPVLTITYHSFKEILSQRKPLHTFRPKAQGFKIVKEKRYDQLTNDEWLCDTLAFLDDMCMDEADYMAA